MKNKVMPQYLDILKSNNPADSGAVNTAVSIQRNNNFLNPWEGKPNKDSNLSFILLEHHLMSINIAAH